MFLFKDTHIRMIPVSPDMSHLFDINAALSKGEVVSIPADRIWGSPKKLVKCFLGGEASFPYGPFQHSGDAFAGRCGCKRDEDCCKAIYDLYYSFII